MNLPEWCQTHSLKEFMELCYRGTEIVHDERQIECQATFKEHCTFPKCDCDRKK